MHHAPPVSYPVGRSRPVGGVLIAVVAAGLAVLGWWVWRGGATGLRWGAVLGAVGLSGWALRRWAGSPAGVLSWDGQAWRWSPRADVAGLLSVHLDFQRLLLVQWQAPDAPADWLWIERKADPRRWPDLRRAVYSRANPDALPEADSPAANP